MITTKRRILAAEFAAEVFGPEGPTGELVFADAAVLQDYGGNKVGGPYSSGASANRAIHKARTPVRLIALAPYRATGAQPQHVNGFTAMCQGVLESDLVKNERL